MKTLARSAAIVAALFAIAQAYAFEGHLVDQNGNPLAGARVQVAGGHGTALVDASGRFVLEPSPPPPFDILIARPDGVLIQPLRVETLPADGTPVELVAAAALTGTLTVHGGSPDLELPPAAAVSVVSRADLAQRKPDQITDVLDGIPGTSTGGSGHTAVPAIRGMSSSRTLLLLDEGRVTSERRAGASATFVDPASLEEVEVVRGPGSVAYGSDAFGGIIRMRTRLPSPGEPASLRYALAGGSNDDQRAVDVDASLPLAGGGFMVGGSYRNFDNYSSPEGEVPYSGLESMSLRTGYQHELGPGLLRFLWRSDLGRDVGKASTNSATKPTVYPEEDSHRATLSYEQPGPGAWSRLAVALFWDEYRLLTETDTLATASKPRSFAAADVFAHDYGLRAEAERPLGDCRLLLGVDASGRYGLHAVNRTTAYDAAGNPVGTLFEESIDRADKDDVGIFAGLFTALGTVKLSGGLRFDWVSTSNQGGYFGDHDQSQSDFSGFLGAALPLGADFELSAQVARGFRDPLLSDRYYRGISGRGFITGNPDLEAETSVQGDLALRYTPGGPLSLAAFVYDYRVDDLIERYKVGNDYFFHNRGTAEVQGVELEATWDFGSGLAAQLAAQWQDGEAVDEDAPIDGVPPAGVILTVRDDSGTRWTWWARLGAYASDDEPGPNEVAVGGYALVDGAVSYRLSDLLQLYLTGRNLLDKSYYATADDVGVLEPGRTLVLGLRGTM